MRFVHFTALSPMGKVTLLKRLPVIFVASIAGSLEGATFVKLNAMAGVPLSMLRLDYDEAKDTLIF